MTDDISAVSLARNSSSDSFGLGPDGMGMSDGSAVADEVPGCTTSPDGLPGPDDEGVGSCWAFPAVVAGAGCCEAVAAENWSSTSVQVMDVSIGKSLEMW